MKYWFWLLLFTFISLKCSTTTDYIELPTEIANKNIDYSIERFSIDISDTLAYKYYDFFYDSDSTTSLAICNDHTKRIELYSISNKRLIRSASYDSISLETEKYGKINGIYMHSIDSLILMQKQRISVLVDFKVVHSREINPELTSDKLPDNLFYNLWESNIYYDPADKSLLTMTYCANCKIHKETYYTAPIEGSISLENKNMDKLSSVHYPSIYLGKEYYGFCNQIYKAINQNKSIHSFPIDPNIYVFDRKNNITTSFGGRSKFHKMEVAPLSKKFKYNSEEKLNHMYEMPHYGSIYYDPFRELYYRFFLKGMPIKNKDGTYNTWGDKEKVLMVFNSTFELVKEIDLGRHTYTNTGTFVGPKGLYLSTGHYKNKEKKEMALEYDIISFNF
ncbi:MAG: DUF4221 family protein [Bacteroidota bacterium]